MTKATCYWTETEIGDPTKIPAMGHQSYDSTGAVYTVPDRRFGGLSVINTEEIFRFRLVGRVIVRHARKKKK